MDELRFGYTCALDDETRVLDLDVYSVIGSFEGDDSRASVVRKKIRSADVDTIRVRINSPGGLLDEALAIYNQLAQHKAQVKVTIDGVAASAATIIAMAGDSIRMSEFATFMIHEPFLLAAGDAKQMQKMADRLDREADQMAQLYAKRTGGDADEIRERMRDETTYTAEEALDAGFIDEVIEGKAQPEDLRIAACAHPDAIARFANAEGRVRPRPVGQQRLPLPAEGSAKPQPKELHNMKTIASALGLPGDATEAQVVQAIHSRETEHAQALEQAAARLESANAATAEAESQREQLVSATQADTVEKALGVIEAGKAATAELTAAQAKLEEQAKAAEQKERESLVSELTQAGKLTPAQRDGWAKSVALETLKEFSKTAPVVAGKSEQREPPANSNPDGTPVPGTKSWDEMSNMERHALWESDPDAYNSMKPAHLQNRDRRLNKKNDS